MVESRSLNLFTIICTVLYPIFLKVFGKIGGKGPLFLGNLSRVKDEDAIPPQAEAM